MRFCGELSSTTGTLGCSLVVTGINFPPSCCSRQYVLEMEFRRAIISTGSTGLFNTSSTSKGGFLQQYFFPGGKQQQGYLQEHFLRRSWLACLVVFQEFMHRGNITLFALGVQYQDTRQTVAQEMNCVGSLFGN